MLARATISFTLNLRYSSEKYQRTGQNIENSHKQAANRHHILTKFWARLGTTLNWGICELWISELLSFNRAVWMHGPEVSELRGEGRKPELFRRPIFDFFTFREAGGES